MKVNIFTEGGVEYGLGHISRCSALYDAFEEFGFSPLMIVNGDDSVKKKVSEKNVLFNNWIENINQKQLINNADIGVVDSYLASDEHYHYFSQKFSQVVYLDDIIRIKYPKGIVLNGAPFAEEMDYPEETEITYLLGNHYTLLQKPFWSVPPKSIADKIENVLITMGGIDAGNLTVKIIHCLKESFPNIKILIPVAQNLKNLDEIQKQKNAGIKLIVNAGVVEMKNLMTEADIAISSSGQTLFELARMGVPAIAIQTAANQRYSIMGWKKAGFIEYAGEWSDSGLSENILSCFKKLESVSVRKEKSETGVRFIDGQGARRIVEKLINN